MYSSVSAVQLTNAALPTVVEVLKESLFNPVQSAKALLPMDQKDTP